MNERALRVAADRRVLETADGRPFFWLGDTCWGSAFRASEEEWSEYVEQRARQGFTVLQMSALPLLSDFSMEEAERRPFPVRSAGVWDFDNPVAEYFEQLDRMIGVANEHGLTIALVVLWWTYVPNARMWSRTGSEPVMNPGQAERFARFLAERLGRREVIWLVTGDDTYDGPGTRDFTADLGASLRRADPKRRLITVHPSRISGEFFHAEAWCDMDMVQSSHFDAYQDLAVSYPLQEWGRRPPKPVVNGEICYEGHAGFDYGHVFDRYDVRRAAWWSVLSGCLVGVTYGTYGVWRWLQEADRAGAPASKSPFRTWREALPLPGAGDLCRMKALLEEIGWHRLRPDPHRLLSVPARHVALAASGDAKLLVAYIPRMPPTCARAEIDLRGARRGAAAFLWDVETGERSDLGLVSRDRMIVTAPDERDCVLVVR